MYQPFEQYFGGFSPNDGTIDFYLRINSLADPNATYLDYGAGRGAWFEDSKNPTKRALRDMRGKFTEVIAADIDPVVMQNRSADRTLQMQPDKVPLPPGSVDVLVADYVLEHIHSAEAFSAEVDRLLKPGGWFCARTPHKAHYIALAARLMNTRMENAILHRVQPGRKEKDVFEKTYKMNTLREVREAFPNYTDRSYCRRSDPAYYFGNRTMYHLTDLMHRLMPTVFSANLFIFLQKPRSFENQP